MTIKFLFLAVVAFALPGGLQAQVIEINDSGAATTFDGPTLFVAQKPKSIGHGSSTASAMKPQELLAVAAKAHGLDQSLLEAVAWQESRGRMSALSPKGALGVMQLMPATAAELGVHADDMSDNIRGGALYLRRQLDRFGGSVPLALAAYNAGPGAVLRFGGIPPYRETREYVARIMQRWQPAARAAVPINRSVIEVLQP